MMIKEEEIAPTDIEGLLDGKSLGAGGFGEVRRVLWRKTPAAAKIAHADMPRSEKLLFLREVEVMTRLRHPNIVQFLGHVDQPFVLIMELVPGGDLRGYWMSGKRSVKTKTLICIDVLRALAYLHNRKPSSIIHRDIKPTNVLIANHVAKLTDFGLGRMRLRGEKISAPEMTSVMAAIEADDAAHEEAAASAAGGGEWSSLQGGVAPVRMRPPGSSKTNLKTKNAGTPR